MRNSIGVDVAQAATRLATEIYCITRDVPRTRASAWYEGARRSSDALAMVIARVQGTLTHTQFIHCIAMSGVLLAELEGYLMLAEQSGHLTIDQLDGMMPVIAFIKRFCSVGLGVDEPRRVKPELVS